MDSNVCALMAKYPFMYNLHGACAVRARCVRGACAVHARCVHGACAVHRDLSTVPNGVDLYALLLNHVGIAIDAISMIFMIDENLPGIGVHL